MAKVASQQPALPNYGNNPDVNCYVHSGHGYTLRFDVKTCHGQRKRDYTGAHYAEASVYLADLSGDTLTRLYAPDKLREDFTEEEIIAARKEVDAAKDALSKAQSKLGSFGEYDI